MSHIYSKSFLKKGVYIEIKGSSYLSFAGGPLLSTSSNARHGMGIPSPLHGANSEPLALLKA